MKQNKFKTRLCLVSLLILFLLTNLARSEESSHNLRVKGIEPNSGPVSGETRVMVRLEKITEEIVLEYPHPKCRFGSVETEVDATYVKCSPTPRKINEPEPSFDLRTDICVQCGNTKPHEKDIVPLTVSLIGDFTDTVNSLPFRFYDDPEVVKIFPESGPQNGGTKVLVTGRNFLNYDQNLRCSFGSREVQATYVNENTLICYSPPSDVVQKKMPFAVTFNFQQKSKEDIPYVYYELPQIFSLEPGRGPDTGGTNIKLFGANFNPFLQIPDFFERNKARCRFDGVDEGNGEVISSTFFSCVTPPSNGREFRIPEISLNGQDWHFNEKVKFYYYHPPDFSSIFPKNISPNGGTEVTIIGSNFEDTGRVKCLFGDVITEGKYVSDTELKCYSPPIEKPGTVPFKFALKDDEYSEETELICFDTPILKSIEPQSGPEYGHTLLKCKGEKFPVKHSEAIKCAFDEEILTDATVIDDETLYCYSPSVLNENGENENNIKSRKVTLTMNEKEFHGEEQEFQYYKQHKIGAIKPDIGPVEGGTEVEIQGEDFSDLDVKNVSVRFATYNAQIVDIDDNVIKVKAPKANYTGPAMVQVSFNGQQFDEKNHNEKNTYRYHKFPVVTTAEPLSGPTNGNADLNLHGLNFIKAYDTPQKTINNYTDETKDDIYYRFVDPKTGKTQGETKKTKPTDNNLLVLKTPKISEPKNLTFELSYNDIDYKRYDDFVYSFYKLPSIQSINPEYGPLDNSFTDHVEVKVDEYYAKNDDDKDFVCKYQTDSAMYEVEGTFEGSNTIECKLPRVATADAYNLEIRPKKGNAYTTDGKNYTFYSPYVMRLEPRLIPSRGGTPINVYGHGFANTGSKLKGLFGAEKEEEGTTLNCNGDKCTSKAKFVDSQHVILTTVPKEEITVDKTGEKLQNEPFPIEVAVYNDDFTHNGVTASYFDEPDIIQDLENAVVPEDIFSPDDKKKLGAALVKSLPANSETFVPIPLDSTNFKSRVKELEPFFKYKCKYELNDDEESSVETNAVLASFPIGSDKYNLFLCETPGWDKAGKGKIKISFNGQDFSQESYPFEFTDPLYVYSVKPTCGPIEGNTDMEFIGTGFRNEDDFYFKWGPQNIVPMKDNFFFNEANDKEKEALGLGSSKYTVRKMKIKSPRALSDDTTGGPDYLSIDKVNLIPLNELLDSYNLNSYKNQNFEYFYYPEVLLESYSPRSADSNKGSLITVVGAFFQKKPEYGVNPICKFGETEVVGTYKSNVRFTCVSPDYHKPNAKVPFSISLNGVDFIKSDKDFTFFSMMKNAKFGRIRPEMGPHSGGTPIKITCDDSIKTAGENADLECMFESIDNPKIKKTVPAHIVPSETGEGSELTCVTPGGWPKGTKSRVYLGLGGDNFLDSGLTFSFYKIDKLFPRSGPNKDAKGEINLEGGGFLERPDSDTIMKLDGLDYKALNSSETAMRFPFPKPKEEGYVGPADVLVAIDDSNKIDEKDGFYFYEQIGVNSFFPKSGPASGHGKILVTGEKFRDDFKQSEVGCKIGTYYGTGKVVNDKEMVCTFEKLPVYKGRGKPPVSEEEKSPEEKPTEETSEFPESDVAPGYPFSVALNNYSFAESEDKSLFNGYAINYITPSSGPIIGGTRITVDGFGFTEVPNIRCRFGVPGYFAYTQAEYINQNQITCMSPDNFQVPPQGQLPFSVPFSIAFNDDEFDPWTETSHFFTFYQNPELIYNNPKEGFTSETNLLTIKANDLNTFSMPSALIHEEIYDVIGDDKEHKIKRKIEYQPIKCRFGRFGTTEATYFNRTKIQCLTPPIADDTGIGYEKVNVEVALNGQNYVKGKDVTYLFKGPGADKMIWVYILMILFIAILAVILVMLASSYWNKIGVKPRLGEKSQVRNRKIKYLYEQKDVDEAQRKGEEFRDGALLGNQA